ncbi:DVUA0089 family protein [Paucibacter sp. KBW04]|uniref:DVUA0089 family protein n=1 Tax=Paucibacter sp. KBW04 TaxID=2153361 RepID=UPI0018CC1834|nr:DVUA0089 family protein [Paucibacter sp. KBW04]
MNKRLKTLAALLLSAAAGLSQAAQYDFAGSLSFDNSVAKIQFSVSSAVGDFKFWTDSFNNGSNFDPVIQLWSMSSPTSGVLLGENDDFFGPAMAGQSSADATLRLANLTAGNYLLTIVANPNYANTSSYADGFALDGATPGALQGLPGYTAHISADGNGLNVTAVPEPSSWALMLMGAAGLALSQRKRKA